MQYAIANEIPGRVRVKLAGPVPFADLDALYRVLAAIPTVEKASVYPRIGSIALTYRPLEGARNLVLERLSAIDAKCIGEARSGFGLDLAPRSQSLLMDLARLAGLYVLRRWFVPRPLAAVAAVWRYRRFLGAGLRSLGRSRLDVAVLDAAAIGTSFLKRDPRTAGQTMFLLDVGETMEEYTRSRSEGALVSALLDLPETAQLLCDDQEVQVRASDLEPGDLVVVRTGMPVCVDGRVVRGVAMVNQASLTGEPLAVERAEGDDVFAGTAVEDGQIVVQVRAKAAETKLRSIVSLVERSGANKAQAQSRMERLADGIVAWNFLLAAGVALVTGSLTKASAALMVDYSCALKLTSSIAVLSAMSHSAKAGFAVKGSKHFEAMAAADVIVFDKTGTLTEATPEVACVLALDGWNRREVLRLSACLEEHFPHPVARAVVRAAAQKNLKHRERHAEVEYIVAHGIASSLGGKRVVIGSEHFVMGDEGVAVSEDQRARIAAETEGLTPLYLAVDDELVGVVGVYDPLKEGVAQAVANLKALGFRRVVMLTGDGDRTAARIAQEAGVTEYRANLLPEDKHAFVERLKAEGRRVVMVGDGVNDAPALSAADVGIAMGQGTAVAKEVADITLAGGDLGAIVELRRLSKGLMQRLDASFREVMLVNSVLLAAGIGGVLTPQASSLLHNASTVALSLRSAGAYRS
ncbi:heavy metal translocating P-type ATPase [Paraeggerthella hongkongensis]|uniref:Heavy metal translocating P-type ATPase n=1 Tax=Paraeggerthella hongkongensis TaxID=230658 RepID=A0A3N0BGA6_9ACTN|nr:heavy metal translocating P-type ATPase [Paraeggerthella hongkongensis]RNL46916.1 heavy metal translocating P-type ATPase [Paraeggerthella hongkongensis]